MNISNVLKKRDEIYGWCALWIMVFHIMRRISMPYIPVVSHLCAIGNCGVDVFLFLSGVSLGLSAKKNNYIYTGWRDYYKKRIKRIMWPYLFIGMPFYIWSAFAEHTGSIARRLIAFAADFSGLSFWLTGRDTTWFVFGILVLYLIFPLLYRLFIKSKKIVICMIFFGLVVFATITSYIPILSYSTIVWARIPIFFVGILFSEKKNNENSYFINTFIIGLGICIGYIVSLSEIKESYHMCSVYRWLLYIPLTIAIITIFSLLDYVGRFIKYLGRVSLEVYLIHIALLNIFKQYGLFEIVGYWLYFLIPVVSFLLAIVVDRVENIMTIWRGEK